MDQLAIEASVRAAPVSAVLADPRLVRRVIKRHRGVPGLGLQVPHDRCYVIKREALLSIVSAKELGRAQESLPEEVILLPRPDEEDDELGDASPHAVLERLWRATFHARIHLEIERRAGEGKLTAAALRERIHRIGQTEFDEIRLVLRNDGLLLPPYDDQETYAEFAALYLELSYFAPGLLGEIFPGLADLGAVGAALAQDLDARTLLRACRPDGAPETPGAAGVRHSLERLRPAAIEEPKVALVSVGEIDGLVASAEVARRKGNLVRSALLLLRAAPAAGEKKGALTEAALADLQALGDRLAHALRPREGGRQSHAHGAHGHAHAEADWGAALAPLARTAVAAGLFRRVEGRLLYDLLAACVADERAIGKVDLVEWALSLGRRKLARLLPATREILVARHLRDAATKLTRAQLPEADHTRLEALVLAARHRAEENIRDALRPPLLRALVEVGFRAESAPERVAREKVVEELLDHATARGFLGIGVLRDAISRNQMKMTDLAGPGQLVFGDALLQANSRLSHDLDGVYRGGEIYLRLLQRLSSLAFGTSVGRFLVRYLILPVGAAFVLLEGLGHVVSPVAHILGLIPEGLAEVRVHDHVRRLEVEPNHIHLLNRVSFPIIAIIIFGLIHSARVRAAALAGARALGWVLSGIFYRGPAWLFSRPIVKSFFRSSAMKGVGRFLIKPSALGALAYFATPIGALPRPIALGAAGAVFVATAIFLNTQVGALAEEIALDAVMRSLHQLGRHVLPGIFRLIADFFRRLLDALDRGIYAVDEWLRFREGQSAVVIALKAIVGLFWFVIAYAVRIFINLMVEPQINPIKHFPVVTVAAKLMLPFYQPLSQTLTAAFTPVMGARIGATLATPLVITTPGFAGFLVWEFKENYKLYQRTRSPLLKPVPIGHHGEAMSALLKPGIHSGTLPKLWAKLRRASRKGSGAAKKHEEALRELEEAVEHFVDRELCALLREGGFSAGEVRVARVALGSNRARVELALDERARPVTISFEEQSGWIVASVPRAGWLPSLEERDRLLFENALAGLYHLGSVDFVREQIEAEIGDVPYDVADEGLVVWPAGYGAEVVYDLHAQGAITPRARGEGKVERAPIERAAIAFHDQPIAWKDWVEAWKPGASIRLVRGTSLLPVRGSKAL